MQFIDVRDVAEWSVRVAEAKLTGNFNAKGPAYPLTVGTMRDRLACTAAVTRAQFRPGSLFARWPR